MKDITIFIKNQLYPRIYSHIPQIFPELNFIRKGNRYISGLHADGTEGTGRKDDRSVVTEKYPNYVYDQTRGAKDVITLFMENNHITETWEAVNRLCSIVGIPQPEYTPEAKERYRQMEQRRTALELSAERQRKALFTPDGKAVLDYLRSRGWTDSEIQEAELGYISTAEAKTIDAQRSVGDFYTLSIPLRSGSHIYGFKFRTIQKDTGGRGKYVYLNGTDKSDLFNLTGIQQTDGSIVVVEGELDALQAEVRGVRGLVATGGGKLTEELLKAATERGIKRITLLFDKDESGEKFVRESIDVAHEKGLSVLVATFPDGESLNDGTPIHDVGEYLQRHSAQELQGLIDNAIIGSKYLLQYLVSSAIKKHGEKVLTDAIEVDLRNDVISLANHTPNEVERDLVLSSYAKLVNIDGKQAFTNEALRAVADRDRAAEDALKQSKETKEVLREATALADSGDVQAALQLMGEAAVELRRMDSRTKYGKLLALPTEESLLQSFKSKQAEIPTLYELSNDKNDKELFTLPSGAITFICAPTSHGKSTLLQNLALQTADSKGDGDILYFTFEEDKDAVTLQMLNKYINTQLCRNYSSKQSNNIRALRHYYMTGEDTYIAKDLKSLFKRKEAEFMEKYYTSGKIRIYYEDYDSAELIEAIRTISSQTKVKAVFIDYIQLLSSRAYKKAHLQRTEELKEICKDLKNLSIDTQLPIVVAAQLNREANSPLELHSQRIAEAADLERIANKVLCLWNTSFVAQKSKDSAKELEWLEAKHEFVLGEGGRIYAKLTKNRGGIANLEAVFSYDGNTGVIQGNYKPEPPKQENLPFEEQQRDKYDIF